MSPEERKLLEETAELAKKNNKILRSMDRTNKISAIFSFLKWVVIIGIALWSYVIIEPFLVQMKNLYEQVQQTTSAVNELKVKADSAFDTSGLQNLLDAFKINGQ